MKDPADNRTLDLLGDAIRAATRPAAVAVTETRGRPQVYKDAAEKQKAYRARMKAKGMRVVTTVIRDVRHQDAPLVSTIIDLSEVRTRR